MNSKVGYPYCKRSIWGRIKDAIMPGPDSKSEVFDILQEAKQRKVIDDDGLAMMEGVLQVSEICVSDVMVPKMQMDMVDVNDNLESVLSFVIAKSHSRFPVFNKDKDKIVGILLAKDLLRSHIDEKFSWADYLRPAVFIPQSKKLNVLLKEFRVKKNHLAVIVDEYSQVVGLITIEDVIEQIVGDIEDEHDYDEDEDHIILTNDGWRIKGLTEIQQFNGAFETQFNAEIADSIAGIVINAFGRIPHKGEIIILQGLRFEVLRTDSRQIHLLKVRKSLSSL